MKGTSVTFRSTRKTWRKAVSTVLRFDLNTRKVSDDVTSDGRLLHVFAAATRKAQSPIVRYRAVLVVKLVLRSKMNAR